MIAAPGVRVADYPNISVKAPGYVAVAYYGSADGADGGTGDGYFTSDGRAYDAYLALITDVFAASPVLLSGRFNDPAKPVISGLWYVISEYLGPPAFAPDGTIWAAYVNGSQGLAGRFVPSGG